MITIRSNHITEKQLAEIALAVQNRWEVPTFVKMHEIVVVDDDVEEARREELMLDFESGLRVILGNLELSFAFRFEKKGRNKFIIDRIPGTDLPSWMHEIEKAPRVPEGVYECPHCGKQFTNDIEYSLHQKLHYII